MTRAEPEALDNSPGTYLLFLYLPDARRIRVGRFGLHRFDSGFYCYVGSAFGPGGLRARLRHHARISRRPHWHIDYLRRHMALQSALTSAEPRYLEHAWATLCSGTPGMRIPVAGLGASDCRCGAHLFSLDPELPIDKIIEKCQSITTSIRVLGGPALKKL